MAFTLHARGEFSLAAAAAFAEGFPGTRADRPPDGLRFAWAVDDDWRIVRAHLRQHGAAVRGELDSTPPADLARRARRDAERIFCLDVDGSGFAALGERDPVVGALRRRFPGLRPVLFFTPYEAAARAIIGHRIRITQVATVKQRLTAELGRARRLPRPRPTRRAQRAPARPHRAQGRAASRARRVGEWLDRITDEDA